MIVIYAFIFLRKKKCFEVCRLKNLHIEIVSTFLKLPIIMFSEVSLWRTFKKKKKEQLEIP